MAQATTTIESVWAAKGNLPSNAIVLTAAGKYPALDGSLITNVGSGDMTAAVYDPTSVAADAFARVNHTGTQTAATISNFDVEVGNNTAVAANTAKVSYTDSAAVTLNTAKVGITPTQASDITANNAKVGITTAQAADIVTNNAKVGITPTQASEITTNNAKVSYTDAAAVAVNTAKVGITPTQASDITANNSKVSYTDSAAVAANTAKVGITPTQASDISTALQAANNLSELTATASVARTNLELGATDTVEFGGLVPPAGTTAEIDAVTTATIGQVMINSETNNIVRFVTPSTYQTLTCGGNFYLPTPDVGSQDFFTLPQSWNTGGIIANQPLATSAPIAIKRKGWSRVTITALATTLTPPQTSGNITASVSGSARIKAAGVKCSQYMPQPSVTSMLNTGAGSVSSYVFDYTSTFLFGSLTTATSAVLDLHVDIYNDTDSEVLVTYTYDSPALYTANVAVTDIRIEALD